MKIEKIEKFARNLYDKKEFIIRMGNINQAPDLGLVLENVHIAIKCNTKSWLKPYFDIIQS